MLNCPDTEVQKITFVHLGRPYQKRSSRCLQMLTTANGIHECSLYIKDGNGHSDITHWFWTLLPQIIILLS